MNRSRITISLVAISTVGAAIFLAGTPAASAQLGIIPRPRVKIGAFFPTNTSLSNAIGNTWIKVGTDVNIPFSLIPIGTARVGIDYVAKGSSSIIPITVMQIIQPSAVARSPVYGGAGVGLWTGHIKGSGTSTRFGFRLVGGFEISQHTFLEAQYDFVDKLGSARADGFSVLIGMRF
jgi:hypothetical protein